MKDYLNNSNVYVGFDESIPAVSVRHNGFQTTEEFRATINAGIKAFQENVGTYPKAGWLADTRKQEALSEEDLAWCNEAIASGCPQLRRIALVIPEVVFGQLSIETFAEISSTDPNVMTSKLFPSTEEAVAWLKS